MQAPTLRDVYEARKTIAPYLNRTPLHFSPGLSEALDAQVYLKHDEYLPLGAFKARGGINLVAHLTQEERDRGADNCFHRQPRPVYCLCLPALRRPSLYRLAP